MRRFLKGMEGPEKRYKRPVFNTRYPTKEELAYLTENELEDELSKRVEDMTMENLMADVRERRAHRITKPEDADGIPSDMLVKLLDTMDIRLVLELAKKSVVVAEKTASDNWWGRRLDKDFPEYRRLGVEDTFYDFYKYKYKDVYFVVRYILKVLYAWFADNELLNFSPKANLSVKYKHVSSLDFSKTYYATNGTKIGVTKTVRIDDVLLSVCAFHKLRRYEFFDRLMQHVRGKKILLKNGYLLATERFSERILLVNDNRLSTLFARGYVYAKTVEHDDGTVEQIPIIGRPVLCVTCSSPANWHVEGDPTLTYCGKDACF